MNTLLRLTLLAQAYLSKYFRYILEVQSTLVTSNFKGLEKYAELSVVPDNQIMTYGYQYGAK